uniref:Transthyretin-like family protein n=1 Tax=Panagrolaimus davidi TaxID=227884 RepID=A0A914PFK4_9BILA
MKSLIAILLVTILSAVAAQGFRQQSVGVRGRLLCGSEPTRNTTIKLWDKNTLGRDTQLASVRPNPDGSFEITGGTGGLFALDVHIKFYTDCGRSSWLPCQRKIDLKIPGNYVTRTSNVQQFFDVGSLNLQLKFKDEDTSCFN